MPQQLSLYASLPESELKITLQTLSSIAGMPPQPFLEHSLLWAPKHPYVPVLAAGQVNQIEQYRIRVSCDLISLTEEEEEDIEIEEKKENSNKQIPPHLATDPDYAVKRAVLPYADISAHPALSTRPWTFTVAELPEAGKLSVISQSLISVSPKVPAGDHTPFEFLDKLGYVFRTEYWTKGYQFVHGNVVVRIFRLCGFDAHAFKNELEQIREAEKNVQPPEAAVAAAVAAKNEILEGDFLRLLDATKRWTMVALINVESITDLDAIARATAELERFRADVAGLVDLELPERNSFDTRIKRR
ncbi:uncharacterized protein SAPINGB_P002679 [Magnusiomyces paraingens]|uniref:Mediator of RNA polymerase II transcription subunit 18 n=1 Tax=Magnusiomyces paraingens TaxID=2606893 RepID=A0A5E8BKX3_9ASCO|nr:uncharacterized protein SAPINGB_P002679 [Saprochaete ingens]VVT50257.1 unnamed protein product [Saprochaete ingens]